MLLKKLTPAVLLLGFMLISKVASAQTDISYSIAEIETEIGKKRLVLTQQQEMELLNIEKQYFQRKKEITSDTKLSYPDYLEKLKQLEKEKEYLIKGVLNKEQFEIYFNKRS